jgi:processive 1,2-diacylglycerol beta-glucosyltransferase
VERSDKLGVKRILILTAEADAARDTAARQLQASFERVAPREARVDRVDPAAHAPDWSERLRSPFQAGALALRSALLDLLRGIRPDVVVALHPAYAALLGELDRGGRTRDYALTALVVEPGEIGWDRAPVDAFIVPNDLVAAALPHTETFRIKTLGYPVLGPAEGLRPHLVRGLRVLWIARGVGRKGPKLLERLLAYEEASLTVVTDDAEISTLVREASVGRQVELVTDFARVPALLARHHLVVAPPETALWQEAIVAGCPLIAFRPDDSAGHANADLLRRANAGGVAERPKEVVEWIERAARDDGRVLELWRRNAEPLGQPHGAEAIVRFLLEQAAVPPVPRLPVLDKPVAAKAIVRPGSGAEKKLLLCDLHTHTTWSDGKLTVPELVDFYGQRGFDCICVTDHLCDPDRLLGRLVNLTGLVIPPGEVARYLAAIEREKKRAWSQYKMLLMAGIEFNKDGYTPKSSAHLLGVDLREPIDPTLDLPALIGEIHAQGGLAIASHPHEIKSEWGKNTLYLWEHVDEFAPLLDAWEIANRDDLFNPVGLRKLPFIASSDFHKPKHIHSWKTLLWCEKDPEAIKQCIRLNRDVSLTLYRDHRFGLEEREERATPALVQVSR